MATKRAIGTGYIRHSQMMTHWLKTRDQKAFLTGLLAQAKRVTSADEGVIVFPKRDGTGHEVRIPEPSEIPAKFCLVSDMLIRHACDLGQILTTKEPFDFVEGKADIYRRKAHTLQGIESVQSALVAPMFYESPDQELAAAFILYKLGTGLFAGLERQLMEPLAGEGAAVLSSGRARPSSRLRACGDEFLLEGMVGTSEIMRAVVKDIVRLAPTDASVLVLGEPGTGKELVAQAIHALSKRKDKRLVTINMSGLTKDLADSALFGHKKGAFTSADADQQGKFEEANGGTLFADELGETPLAVQPKLLRAIEYGDCPVVGGQTKKVDVRVVAATNRNLGQMVAMGAFKSDLLERFKTFVVRIPPLRNRKEDIPVLVRHFLARIAEKLGVHPKRLDERALRRLADYDWPGNVRELSHTLYRSVVLAEGDVITAEEVRLEPTETLSSVQEEEKDRATPNAELCFQRYKDAVDALIATNDDKPAAALRLDKSVPTLNRWLRAGYGTFGVMTPDGHFRVRAS